MEPLKFERLPKTEARKRAASAHKLMATRRSVRQFSPDPIPLDAVRDAIAAAAQAPSGANKQPWTFVLVTDPARKRQIREAAEQEERTFYEERASAEWLADLEVFQTDWRKPFLEIAPALVVIFAQANAADGGKHYYVKESVGIAAGMLIATLHRAGFATLTHTPSPMGFLRQILERPDYERPFLLIPVGYPADDCVVPKLTRKPLSESLVEF